MRVLLLLVLTMMVLAGWPSAEVSALPAPAGQRDLCTAAILQAEQAEGIPDRLLLAVALAESGRWDKATGQGYAWPWTVTNGGAGSFFADQAAAMRRVDELRAAGESNIDVGCMQVNLRAHPAAFADLPAAFDPVANARYAAAFLRRLYEETDDWSTAVAYYHSRTPGKGAAYRDRVYARLDKLGPADKLAGAAGQLASAPPPMAPADADAAENVMAIWHWLRAGAKSSLVAQAGAASASPPPSAKGGTAGTAPSRPAAAGGIAVGRLFALPARIVAAN